MRSEIVIVCLSTALNLLLWGALYHRLRGLPLAVWKVAQRDRAGDEQRALDVLQTAAASRLGGLVIGIRTYHEQLAGLVCAQLAEAEVRARLSERQSSEAGIALSAASALVRDLRTLRDGERSRLPSSSPSAPADGDERETLTVISDAAPVTPPSTRAGDDGRRTSTRPPPPVEMKDADGRLSGDDELTSVSPRRLAGAPTGAR